MSKAAPTVVWSLTEPAFEREAGDMALMKWIEQRWQGARSATKASAAAKHGIDESAASYPTRPVLWTKHWRTVVGWWRP